MRPLKYALTFAAFAVLPLQAATLQERMETCLACHGEKGQSETPDTPSLGAQPAPAMLIQLYLFREKRRTNETMNEMAKDMTDSDLQGISDFLSKLPPPNAPAEAADPARMAQGAAVAQKNHCGICHNADFSGRDSIPRIAAQREDYLLKSLRAYKSGERKGYDAPMAEVLLPMSDADIVAVSYYVANWRQGR
jgi:cytochrome c553